jgi:hypothetical protein
MQIKNYQAVEKFPILKAYLHHFSQTSMKNDMPGLLSFFFIQGQTTLPYIRLPTGDSHLDLRVHVFWIQPSRTGKSIAWNFISDIMKEAEIPFELFASGTDAGLIGSTNAILDKDNKPTGEVETVEGLLAGRKAINFDEGSILLTPNKHSQETVLYLQTACNPVGSGNNTLVKHMKGNKVECPSLVSLWITTYPPSGVKEYVLTKGIFQRVLLYYRDWDMEERQEVSNRRLGTFFNRSEKTDITKDDLYEYFRNADKRIRDRLLDLSELTFTQWSELTNEGKEEIVQEHMWEMFSATPEYSTALYQASDELYDLLRDMSPSMAEIVASFTPAIENYLGIFSVHMAILDNTWEVNATHVDMAHEILFDLFQNLIAWLEDSVEVGGNKQKEAKAQDAMIAAYLECTSYEIDGHGDGWRLKNIFLSTYMERAKVSKSTADRHFKNFSQGLFKSKTNGGRAYIRKIGDTQ